MGRASHAGPTNDDPLPGWPSDLPHGEVPLGGGPGEAAEGDIICVFFGHAQSYVLRRMKGSSAGSSGYWLVGHCFVEGIMDGELMETALTGQTAIPGLETVYFELA